MGDICLDLLHKNAIKGGNGALLFVRVEADSLDDKVMAVFPNSRV
jgi:hypothetical protein